MTPIFRFQELAFRNDLLENGDSVPNGKTSETESGEEGDGIFEKIKKKVEDIID